MPPEQRACAGGALALLRALVRPHWRRALAGGAILVASTLVHLAVPVLLGSVVDAAIGARRLARLNDRALLLVAVALGQALLALVATILLRSVAERMTVGLRHRLFGQLLRLPLPFHQGARSGELSAATTSDVAALQQVLGDVPALAIPAPLLIVGSLVLMLRQSVALTLLICAAAPPMIFAVRHFGARIRKASAAAQAATAAATGTLQEALAGIETVQAACNEALHAAHYDAQLERAYGCKVRQVVAEAAFSTAAGLAAFAAFAAAFWVGGRLVIRGELSGGALVALLAYATYLQGAISSVTQVIGSVQAARGALARPLALLALPAAAATPTTEAARLAGDVRFERVSYRHEARAERAVDDVSLHVPLGSVCALVGTSGAGKTTLARLLFRFYEAEHGRIRIGDVDIATVPLSMLRRSLAYVPQEPLLFTGNVRDNIRYGRPDASDAEIEAAARAAYAHDFILALPAGYDTPIGERGATLSGGQRQRIAIARAVLADPSVLVLDEATSALDAESERCVQRALERLRAGRVTLVIAHRASTIERADLVAVIHGGRLVELRKATPPRAALEASARSG